MSENAAQLARVFVPLSSDPYEWFRTGQKVWELRRERGQFQRKHLLTGRRVELRRGYSDRATALWGHVGLVHTHGTLREVFSDVSFQKVVPPAKTIDDALQRAGEILGLGPDDRGPLIVFEVLLDRSNRDDDL